MLDSRVVKSFKLEEFVDQNHKQVTNHHCIHAAASKDGIMLLSLRYFVW